MKTKPAEKIKKSGKKTISEVKQAFRQPAVRRGAEAALYLPRRFCLQEAE